MNHPTHLPTTPQRGALIVFEGIDGTGKSTQVQHLTAWLQAQGHTAVQSYEPTRGPFGQTLRASMQSQRLPPREELDLFIQDRGWHLENTVLPALRSGTHVVLDRYYLSTAAYQGHGHTTPQEILQRHVSFAPAPDLLFLLDMDPAVSLQRAHARSGSTDTFEIPELLQRARSTFLHITQDLPYAHTIDASKPLDDIHTQIIRHTEDFMSKFRQK